MEKSENINGNFTSGTRLLHSLTVKRLTH